MLRKETSLVLPREGSPAIGLRSESNHGWPSVMEWHAIVRGLHSLRNCEAPTLYHRVQITLLAELRSSCSLRPCVGYAPCGMTDIWSHWALPSVGPGPIAYCMVWAHGTDDAIRHQTL
ncbi:hypothetical protein Tco_0091432 [Tanacetum coccineum]